MSKFRFFYSFLTKKVFKKNTANKIYAIPKDTLAEKTRKSSVVKARRAARPKPCIAVIGAGRQSLFSEPSVT